MSSFRIPFPGYSGNNSIAELMMRQGQIEAEGHRASGNLWADVLNRLGAIPAQVRDQNEALAVSKARRGALEQETAARRQQGQVQQRRGDLMAQGAGASAGGRERVIQGLMEAGDLEGAKMARESFEEVDKSLKRHFGTVAARIRAFKDSPDAALVAIDDFAEQGFDPKHFEKYRAMIQENPSSVTGIVDFLLSESPEESHRKLVTPAQKPGEGFTLGPGQTRFGPDGKPLASVEAKAPTPEARVVSAGGALVDPTGKVLFRAPTQPGTDKLERVETTDAQGKPVTQFVTPTAGASYPKPTGAGKPATGQQRKALSFFNRGKEAEEIASSLEQGETISPARIKYTPEFANFLQSSPNQAYIQAQRAFTEARLRKESGAAVPESEYEKDALTYFAQPGDTKETIAQKRAARNAVLAGIAFESGDALKEFYGDEAEGMVERYKGAGAKGARSFDSNDTYGYAEGTVIQGPKGQMVLRNGRWVEKK